MFTAVLSEKFKTMLGEDTLAGLLGMFFILHFYYGVGNHGWLKTAAGAAAIFVIGFFLSFIAYKLGNAFRLVLVFTSGALALDFFYRAQAGEPAASYVFNYLANGPAVINFASFGFLAIWFASQLAPVLKGKESHKKE